MFSLAIFRERCKNPSLDRCHCLSYGSWKKADYKSCYSISEVATFRDG